MRTVEWPEVLLPVIASHKAFAENTASVSEWE